MIQQTLNKKQAVNIFANTGRYFQTLPPRKQREAEKLEKHFKDVQRIFMWEKGE